MKTSASDDGIVVFNIGRFGHNRADDERLADEVGEVFRTAYGFCAFVGHGIDPGYFERAYDVSAEVFLRLSEEQKIAYQSLETGRFLGYTPVRGETSAGHATPNLMEFWHLVDPRYTPIMMRDNILPRQVPRFGPIMFELFDVLKQFGLKVLRLIAVHLRRDPEFFVKWVMDGNNLLRTIFYPELTGDEREERSGQHEDVDLITVLHANSPGLQIKLGSGEWMDANSPEGALVCNLGDQMQTHTFGILKSTTHRVINPQRACPARQSLPLFLQPGNRPLVMSAALQRHRFRANRQLAPHDHPNMIDHD